MSLKQAVAHIPKPKATVHGTGQVQHDLRGHLAAMNCSKLAIQERCEEGNCRSRARFTPLTKWAQITLSFHHPAN